jgi:hypothetical protein
MLHATGKTRSARIVLITRRWSLAAASAKLVAFSLLVAVPLRGNAAQFVQITAELRSTNWIGFGVGPVSEQQEASHTVRCVVGTNTWFVEEDFADNEKVAYLFTGTNIIEHFVVNDKSVPQEKTTQVHNSPHGKPIGADVANVGWLAFCSGTYLKQSGRLIPLPVEAPYWLESACSDRTMVFDDGLGLPKSVDLYATNGQCICHYEVLQSTNFLGWTFPLRFKLTQYGGPGECSGGPSWWGADLVLVGQATSIQAGREPRISAQPK